MCCREPVLCNEFTVLVTLKQATDNHLINPVAGHADEIRLKGVSVSTRTRTLSQPARQLMRSLLP